MSDIERQLSVLDRILQVTDKEIHDINFLLNAVKEYGVTPLSWLQELDDTTDYTEDGMIQVPSEFALFCHYLGNITVVMCYRESLRDYPLQQLKNYNSINIVITDDKIASFI